MVFIKCPQSLGQAAEFTAVRTITLVGLCTLSWGFGLTSAMLIALVLTTNHALADNGGLTLTHLPQIGSPLIDSGNCDSSTLADQRGAARPQGYGCDVGAVEAPGPFLRFLPVISD